MEESTIRPDISVSGAGADAATLATLAAIAPALGAFLSHLGARNAYSLIKNVFVGVDHGMRLIERQLGKPFSVWNLFDRDIGKPLVDAFFASAIGVKTADLTNEQDRALDVYRQFLGFALTVPFAISVVATQLNGWLGKRFGGESVSGLMHLPQELGISWALGMMLDRIVETASAQPINEAINSALHPARIEWPVLRTLARQHVISEKQFDHLLNLAGFDEERRAWIKRIDVAQLTPSDIQSAFLYGLLTREQCAHYLETSGYDRADVNLLLAMYIDRAATPAQNQYRSELRTALLEQRITNEQYTTMARQINTPDVDITTTIAAVAFELQVGRAQQTATTLKKMYLSGHLTVEQAVKQLEPLGYVASDAQTLVASWTMQAKPLPKPLSSAKVLTYLKSTVLTEDDAYSRLVANGVVPKDARFLVQHPDTKASTPSPPYEIATIEQAFFDKVIDANEATLHLQQLHESSDEAARRVAIWTYKLNHSLSLPPDVQRAALADTRAAYLSGALSDAAALAVIEDLNMAPNDAQIVWAGWYATRHGGVGPVGTAPEPV